MIKETEEERFERLSKEEERFERLSKEARRAQLKRPRAYPSRRKCSFKNSDGHATVDVYPDGVSIESDSGYSYNSIPLTLNDLKKIKECILM